jgi:hypothetical protein
MSDAVWIAIIVLVAAVFVADWYKRRRRRPTTAPRGSVSAPSPAPWTEPTTLEAPSLSEMPAESGTTAASPTMPAESSPPQVTGEKTPLDEKDAEGYPDYMRLPEVAAGPRVLLPHDTPTALKQEVRHVPPPPLSGTSRARDAFVGRWVRFQNGIVRGVREGIQSYTVIIAHERENSGDEYVILTFPRTRRAELERLREGQRITYEGQIRKAEDDILELVRVKIDPPPDPSGSR